MECSIYQTYFDHWILLFTSCMLAFTKTGYVENIADATLGPFKLGLEGSRMAEMTENRHNGWNSSDERRDPFPNKNKQVKKQKIPKPP